MSAWLEEHRALLGLVAADLRRQGVKETGRHGLPAESVLRCALLEQHRQLSYQELALHLEDSASLRAFARLPHAWSPQKCTRRSARSAPADGSYASRHSQRRAEACGVRDIAFDKKGGLRIEDMVRSRWVYRKLRNFRAGIEADISCLKGAYALARCSWRGLGHFRAYVWSAVVPTTSPSSPASSRSDVSKRRHKCHRPALVELRSRLPPLRRPEFAYRPSNLARRTRVYSYAWNRCL